MSRYYDYTNGISWQNQNLSGAGVGVGGQKESSRNAAAQAAMYQHAPHPAYTSAAQDSRAVMPVAPRASALYSQSMYHQYQQQGKAAVPSYPVLPDVKLKRLPFYDVMAEVMKPSSLQPSTTHRLQEAAFTFFLTPKQATDVATGRDVVGVTNKLENIVQVQLRFCLVETSCEQEDFFPPSCGVKVNGKLCPLPSPIPTNKPGVEPKRPPRPVNITSLLKLSPTVANTMNVSWSTDFTRNYAISVSLVRKLTSSELLARLRSKGTKYSEYTRSLIKDKLREDVDCEIATTSLRVSLVCPLGKMRMCTPCRPSSCSHLQCFDASLFLQMNERKPTWLCPVCDKQALYDNLVVDGYFQEVLNSLCLDPECCEVQLHKDGSWSPHIPKKEAEPQSQVAKEPQPRVDLVSDDLEVIPLSDGSNSSTGPPAKKAAVDGGAGTPVAAEGEAAPAPRAALVDLTSDSEDDLPLKRKIADSTLAQPEPLTTSHIKYGEPSAGSGVSSSGYQSPGPHTSAPGAIISLDSPSPPPGSPQPAHQASLPAPRPALWPEPHF